VCNLKYPAVPESSADKSCQVPDKAIDPAAAVPNQSLGKTIVARTEPVLAVAASAGLVPVLIVKIGLIPTAVSIAANVAFRDATDN
jgi:hypothetical protein